MHLKDILKVFYAVAPKYYERFSLDEIAEGYKGEHRIGNEAKELIDKGETTESIAKEAIEELRDIEENGGFITDIFYPFIRRVWSV